MDYASSWYSFTRQIANLQPCSGCGSTGSSTQRGCGACGHLQMREKPGFAVSFATTLGENKVIRTYPTLASDVGYTMIYQGYDSNGIWVRTQLPDGTWIDGEQVELALPFVDTVTIWKAGAPTGVIREATSQRVLVYSYDTVTAEEKALAIYQPNETRPMFRQSFIPNFRSIRCCGCDANDANPQRTVTALVSLQHIPLEHDNDWLIFQNVNAYKMAMQAAKLWEDPSTYMQGNAYFYGTQVSPRNGRGVERVVNRGAAIPLLVAELRKMTGDRTNAMVYSDETLRPINDMLGFR